MDPKDSNSATRSSLRSQQVVSQNSGRGGEETWEVGEEGMGAAAQAIEKQLATGILLFFPHGSSPAFQANTFAHSLLGRASCGSLGQRAHTCACMRTTSPPLKVLGALEGEANMFLSGHTD